MKLQDQSPWKSDPRYFKTVFVSALALMKMTIHADSGGDIEVMGMMLGKVITNGLVIMDSYSLPVIGTETRVNAAAESYEFMVNYLNGLKKLGYRKENIVGWYHSHPGYGTWLSGIDVATESLNQQFQDPYLAVVIDPKKSRSDGKVDIGAFRTYPQGEDVEQQQKETMDIPKAKLKDYGIHSKRYYSLDVQVFKNSSDEAILKLLWNLYWMTTISDMTEESSRLETHENLVLVRIQDFVGQYPEVILGLKPGRTVPVVDGKKGEWFRMPPAELAVLHTGEEEEEFEVEEVKSRGGSHAYDYDNEWTEESNDSDTSTDNLSTFSSSSKPQFSRRGSHVSRINSGEHQAKRQVLKEFPSRQKLEERESRTEKKADQKFNEMAGQLSYNINAVAADELRRSIGAKLRDVILS